MRAFREVDDSRLGSPLRFLLGSLEHPLPQDLEAASAIHLSLEELQAMHLALYLAL